MTIINSYYKKPATLPTVNLAKAQNVKHILKSKFGFVSISLPIIVISFFFVAIISYLSIYAQVHSYDYKIYSLKTDMQKTIDENNQLKESLIKNVSPNTISQWAQANSYVEVAKVEYFDLQSDIVAVNIQKTVNQ